jgi:hypothetical protein
MHSNESRRSGQRSGRGSRRGGPRPRPESRAESRVSPPPAKKTFWQKIASLFGFNGKPNGAVSPHADRPVYQPRNAVVSSDRAPRDREARTAPRPEQVEVTSPKLYVGNLSFDTTESDLTELFNGVGKVQNVEIVTHKETERSKGFGFVFMTSVDEGKRAVLELHNKEFMGRKLVVSGAKASADRSA